MRGNRAIRVTLRTIAVGLALAAVFDPAVAVTRTAPLPVEIRAASTPEAARLRQRTIATLGRDVSVSTGGQPAALIVVGDQPLDPPPGQVPVFTITEENERRARFVRISAPDTVLAGQMARITAVLEGPAAGGEASTIALELHGIELSRVEHRWSGSRERFVATLAYAPPAAGVDELRVVARLSNGPDPAPATADFALPVLSRPLRVLVYERRPSWSASFVRRVLESDPVFDVAALTHSSRGIAVESGEPPRQLSARMAERFDAIVVGAPEDLDRAEVDALDAFAGTRGGAVVLLSDRRPSGDYLRLLPADGFDEVLLQDPVSLEGASAHLRGAEFAVPRGVRGGGQPLAGILLNGAVRAVIASWPHGRGRVVFSGALDWWRYPAPADEAFGRFWGGAVASLAAAAPPPIAVRVEPALAAPGDRLRVRAVLRDRAGDVTSAPIGAELIAADGSSRTLRLWPGASPGEFEAALPAPRQGRYDVRASAGGLSADAPLIVRESVHHAAGEPDVLSALTSATGGALGGPSNLEAIAARVRGLGRTTIPVDAHPTQSAWWACGFAAALCLEWILRRRAALWLR